MENKIKEFVKSIGLLVALRSKKVTGTLIYYVMDWLGRDSNYYSLLAICNETQIISKDLLLLGNADENDSLINPLSFNLRQFSSKSDWIVGKWELEDAKKYDSFLSQRIEEISLDGCDTVNCRITDFNIFLRPVIQYVVGYCFNGRSYTSVLSMGNKQILLAESSEHAQFLNNVVTELRLHKFVKISRAMSLS